MSRFFQKLQPLFARGRLMENARAAFSVERTICRLIAAWCCFVLTSLGDRDAFIRLSWGQETELWQVALISLAFFAVFSLVAVLVDKINTDALFLLFASTACVCYWCSFAPTTGRDRHIFSVCNLLCSRAFRRVGSCKNAHVCGNRVCCFCRTFVLWRNCPDGLPALQDLCRP